MSKVSNVNAPRKKIPTVRLVPSSGARLGALDAAATEALLSAAGDLSLVLDSAGVVLSVNFGSEEMAKEGYKKWIDQPWIETVTPDSRSKIEALLNDASKAGEPKWRHVNHTSSRGSDVPVLYTTVSVGQQGQIVAVGRDLRDVAVLQQRLMDAQQTMERDYWRLRNVETRYRMLFQMSAEAIFIVDGNGKLVELNPAAAELLGEPIKRLVGKSLADSVGAESGQALEDLIAGVRATGRADDTLIQLGPERRQYLVSSLYFREDSDALFLLRVAAARTDIGPAALPKALLRAIDYAADAFVVTDLEGRILSINRAFLDLAQMPSEMQVRGEMLDRWIGRSRVDFSVLMANLRQHSTVRLFATTLTGEQGAVADIEISATSVIASDPPCFGFNIRNVGVRTYADQDGGTEAHRSVEQLTELVGRVPLKELVRDATDVVEKLCIEAALQLTGDNRASAAEVLGVSRQNLYVKLRRYGLGDPSLENDEPEPAA